MIGVLLIGWLLVFHLNASLVLTIYANFPNPVLSSPNGQQFLSCKEASSYLLASCGVQDAGQTNPGLADGNVQIANKVGSYVSSNTISFQLF